MPRGWSELAGALLLAAGADGIEVADADTDATLARHGQERVAGWLPARPDVAERARLLIGRRLAAAGLPPASARLTLTEEVDPGWADAWRRWFRPVRVGRRLVVRAPWSEVEAPRDSDVELIVEPGMAFGTGGHATTRLCLAAVEAAVDGGARDVLDVGTGSGVLAIAAARLGARRVVAVDTDPLALAATVDNARRNGVEGGIEVRAELPDRTFDLVVANIVSPTLRSLRDPLASAVAPGGGLVLSGVLAEEADSVEAFFTDRAASLVAGERTTCDEDAEWVALRLDRVYPGPS